jgi:hypothetical protein
MEEEFIIISKTALEKEILEVEVDYFNHGRTDTVLTGFTATDKAGRNQAPYYNDMRKEKKGRKERL